MRANYFCYTAKPLVTKHVQSRRLNISLFGVFLWTSTLSRSTITHTQKKKTQRMQKSSSLRLEKNEYLFAFIDDRLSFFFTFLLLVPSIKQQGYCFKRWNVFLWIKFYGCHSLIFIFSERISVIILSDKYWKNQALGKTKVVRKSTRLLRRIWKNIFPIV